MRTSLALLLVVSSLVAAAQALAQEEEQQEPAGRIYYTVDTPFYTLRGPEQPMVALIQTEMEVEYIGDYLELDMNRAKSALRLLGHVDFVDNMLLIVNGGPIEGAMLRVDSVYEEEGELHVVVVAADPPEQFRDSDFSSPTDQTYTPSLVTVVPRFQGRIVVHSFATDWAASGDLRGVQLLVIPTAEEAGTGAD
jgi:hypothetical protein